MVTKLTNTGWSGLTTDDWTDRSNNVTDKTGGIVVEIGTIADTLSGKDSITGSGGVSSYLFLGRQLYYGVLLGNINNPNNPNVPAPSNLIMNGGNGSITGIATGSNTPQSEFVYGIAISAVSKIIMSGNNNSITGEAAGAGGNANGFNIMGIYNRSGIIEIRDGNNNSIFGQGDATIFNAIGNGYLAGGIFNGVNAKISIGNGNNNSITGKGEFLNGITNRAAISIGNGNNNSIIGMAEDDGAYGLFNITLPGNSSASITMGDGNNNSITGTVKGINSVGIKNGSELVTGAGNIIITMGNGNNNSIIGIAEGSGSVGIQNLSNGIITMGNGTGSITGKAEGNGGIGIYNDGLIDTGGGKDLVDALTGGFAGTGTTMLGNDDDTLKGFGTGYFDGGNGKKDTLLFGSGTYTVSDTTAILNGYYTVSLGAIDMYVKNFEFIGNASNPAHTLNFSTVIGNSFTLS
jgi:hypothetical protein